jgi:hypothetical protein
MSPKSTRYRHYLAKTARDAQRLFPPIEQLTCPDRRAVVKAGIGSIVWPGLLTTSAFIVLSPLLGFFLALLLMLAESWTVVRANPRTVERTERPDVYVRIVASLLPKQRMLRLTTGCGFIGFVSGQG